MSTKPVDKIQYFDKSPTCACKVSVDYLGDKWILVIIRDLFRKRFTFSQFMYDSDEKIASNILTDRGVELYDIIYQLQYWTLQNVNFTFSENTKIWKKLSEELPREKVIEQFKENYKEFRKKTFGF